MKKNIFKLIVLICCSIIAKAQQKLPLVFPDSLRENADAIILYDNITFTVKNPGKAVEKVSAAIMILNEKGDEHGRLLMYYNKFDKISDIDATLYDGTGKKLKTLKRDDIEKIKTSSNSNTLIDDNYVKYISFNHTTYPYIFEYEYERTTTNMMFYPSWSPTEDEHVSVLTSTFKVEMPTDMLLKYNEVNLKPTNRVAILKKSDYNLYEWHADRVKAYDENNDGPWDQVMQSVKIAPNVFEVDDYKGEMNSWADIGKFQYQLNEKRDELPTELTAKLQQMVVNKATKREKVKTIYQYMQDNTRYVSIQLGIGGWQSMLAKDVANKGYGDCKALSNYMKAMLKAVNINSNFVLVRAGDDAKPLESDFPHMSFNHIFLAVPDAKDTIWLECTSQSNPFGYLSDFTSDRKALWVSEKESKLITTPKYKSIDNQQLRKASCKIEPNGEGTVSVKTIYTGLQYDMPAGMKENIDIESQKRRILARLEIGSGIELQHYNIGNGNKDTPIIEESMGLKLKSAATKSGTRFFVTPNYFNKLNVIEPTTKAKKEFIIKLSYLDIDTISIDIPKDLKTELIPSTFNIQSPFGNYKSEFIFKEGTLLYIRRLQIENGRFPVSEYPKWADFRKKIAKADKAQFVLIAK